MLRRIIFLVACGGMMTAACTKQPDVPPPPVESEGPVTVDDLNFEAFSVSPDENERIFADVVFAPDDSGVWKGKIIHYTADVTRLKASFKAVASKVAVGDSEQVSGVTANDFSKPVVYTLYADDGQHKEFTVSLENGEGTGVPIVAIFTDGQKPVDSKEKWVGGRIVFDSHGQDEAPAIYDMEIKGRGNNTWRLDKKPYAVKLAEKSVVMGMEKNKRWVLLANASDRTLLRNRVAFELGRRTGLAWTPDSRFVEVILNGKYLGNYLLCEQIKVDKNRVDITEMKLEDTAEPNITGGYLLELDRYYDEVNKFRSALRDLPVMVKEPDEDVLQPEQLKYITDYVNHIEELLYGGAAVDKSYTEYLDMDSFIDWWIVMELTTNNDSRLPGSCYMYKDRGGKLCAGPLWDFDMTTFKSRSTFLLYDYRTDEGSEDYKKGQRALWYERLFTDPQFKARAKERWQSYKGKFDDVAAFIDEQTAALHPSAEVNWSMWSIDSEVNHDEKMSWDEAVATLRKNYLERLEWMDTQISLW